MASLSLSFGVAAAGGRVFAATATTKSRGGGSEEKGLLDWIQGVFNRDQLLETDPILNKVDEENGSSGSGKSTTSVSVPNKKKSGSFGGLFAKK